MMTQQELIQRLSQLEWEDFEVKAAHGELPKSVWETVSSFSNTRGGWIILGVHQKGLDYEITGVKNPEKLEQDFLNTLRGSKFNEFIHTEQDVFTIDGKTVLAFRIPVHAHKPIYFNTQSNTYIRRGSADQKASSQEVDAMLRDRSFGTRTSEIAPGTDLSSLNRVSLTRYRDYMVRFNPNAGCNRYSEDEFLQKMRIMDGVSCTYAGLLMLGKREAIEKHFPDFRVDLLEIPGTSYADAKQRYTYRLEEQENLWEYYFECFARLKQKVDVTFVLNAEGFGQELSPGLESIREGLVNFLMHADYFSPAKPRIRLFDDRVEFYNPGGLPKPFAELKGKDISLPRNPILAKCFRMVRLAENAGFGLDKMEEHWKAYNHSTPEFSLEFDSVMLSFKLKDIMALGLESGGESGVESGGESGVESNLRIRILHLLSSKEMAKLEIALALGKSKPSRHHDELMVKLLSDSLVEYTIPDKPNSRLQKYRITAKGKKTLR